MKKEEIRIRDPFILVEGDTYYMYGTTDLPKPTIDAGNTFSVYVSKDLENFEGPFVVFDGEKEGFWADRDYWAAEVWKYNGKFYLFGSFKALDRHRATQILVADSPMGPFKPISGDTTTPAEWECLDGTLYVEDGQPYMVFCHEWTQVHNGEMCAVKLKPDFSGTIGEPVLLFKAGDNPCVPGWGKNHENKITDGPFLYRKDGKVRMIWSSSTGAKYAVLIAEADSLFGEWTHYPSYFDFDGGHAMIFTDLNGNRLISLHHPDKPPSAERATFLPFKD